MRNIIQKTVISLAAVFILGSAFASTPKGVVTADVTSTKFVVLWYSESIETGYVNYGTNISSVTVTANDVRGESYSGKLHKVEIKGLSPGTVYYFSVNSGGTLDDNQGAYYSIQAPSSSGFPSNTGYISISNVYKYLSLTPVTGDVIIKAQVSNSGEKSLFESILFNASSMNYILYESNIEFGDFKKEDGTYFDSLANTDQLSFEAWSADDGFISNLTVNSVAGTAFDIILNRTTFDIVTINDTTPPADVSSASATAGVGMIALTWLPSISSDNIGTRIIRSTSNYPVTITDGVTIYSQNGVTTTDMSLTIGSPYYYTLFAYDNNGNYSSGVTLSATPTAAVVIASLGEMFDDFEDSDNQNNFGHYWYAYSDSPSGNSVAQMQINKLDAANGTTVSNKFAYTLGDNGYQDRFAGLGSDVTANGAELNMTSYTGLVFFMKGSGHEMSVVLQSGEVTDNDDFVYTLNTPTDWMRYIIPFTSFSQSGWGATKNINAAIMKMKALQFKASSKVSGEIGWYRIDEVSLTTTNVPTDNTPPTDVAGVSTIVNASSIAISWTASTSLDNAGTRLVRSTSTYPTTVTDGETIQTTSATAYTDSSVSTGVSYYYALFAYDYSLNYASGVTISAVPTAQIEVPSSGNLFDNFEDGDTQNNWKYYWYTFSDVTANFGDSSVGMQINNLEAANGTTYSSRVDYTLGAAYQYRFVGLGSKLTADAAELDMSQYSAVEFYVKGDGTGKQMSVVLQSGEVTDDNDFSYTITSMPGTWTKYIIPFTDFSQDSTWGTQKNINDAVKRMTAIQFKASSQISGETGWYRVDEVNFTNDDITAPDAPTNVTIISYSDVPLQIQLSWAPSISLDNAGTRIIRKTSGYAADENDGSFIHQGPESTYIDNKDVLTKNVYYYYTLFAYDNADNYSVAEKKRVIFTDNGGLQATTMEVSANFRIGSNLIFNNDYVDSQVTITFYVTVTSPSASGIITLNVTGAGSQTLTFNPTTNVSAFDIALTLTKNSTTLKFHAEDLGGEFERSLTLKFALNESIALKPGSQILPYPAPYNPDNGKLRVAYELNKAAPMKVYIYNIRGQLVYKDEFLESATGGSAGYNEVLVETRTAFGSKWVNGLYIIRLMSDNSIVGTGKFLVIR